jgi:hypothetical protein
MAFHRRAGSLTLRCNIRASSFTPRRSGAPWRIAMDIVGVVMLGSVALWMFQQFERHDL